MTGRAFGHALRSARTAAGLSRPALAAKAGVSPQVIASIEGPRPPKSKRETIIAVATAAGMNVNESLAMYGYDPLPAEQLGGLRPELDQMWPELTGAQQELILTVMATVLHKRRVLSPSDTTDGFRMMQIIPGTAAARVGAERRNHSR